MKSDLKIGDIVVCTKAFDHALPGDSWKIISNEFPFPEYFGIGRFVQDSLLKSARGTSIAPRGMTYYLKTDCVEPEFTLSNIKEPSEDIYNDLI